MSTIYVVSDRGKMLKEGETLRLETEECRTTLFPYKTEQLVIMGSVEITGPALKLLMRHNIDTVFLGKNGRYNGRIAFQDSKNVFLRQRQFRLADDGAFRLRFGKSVASGKMKNQLAFMQRAGRREGSGPEIERRVQQIRQAIHDVESAQTLDQVRGYEGLGARNFFSVFRSCIVPDWAVFNGRSMHPPEDNVNAVLSFLYTMVLFRVDAAVEVEGLDGYVGYLHELDYGKRTLTFDLMEEFRTPIADTLTAALFNLGVLCPDDFEEVVFSEKSDEYPLEPSPEGEDHSAVYHEKKGVLLNKDGLKKVIAQFERKLETEYYYQPLLKSVPYKRVIREQVAHFKRVLTGQENDYKPLLIK